MSDILDILDKKRAKPKNTPKGESDILDVLGKKQSKAAREIQPTPSASVEDSPEVADTPKSKQDTNVVTVGELKRMLNRYGLNEGDNLKQVKDLAVYFGAEVPGHEAPVEKYVGLAGEMTGGLAQKYTIMKQKNPEVLNMLEDLREMAAERKSGTRLATEIAGGLVLPGAAVKSAKGMMALGTAGGATAGAAQARSGDELRAAFVGGSLGLGLTGALAGVGKLAARKLPKEAQAEVRELHTTVRNLPNKKRAEIQQVQDNLFKIKPHLKGQSETVSKLLTDSPDELSNAINDVSDFSKMIGGFGDKRNLLSPEDIKMLQEGRVTVPKNIKATPVEYLAWRNYQTRMNEFASYLGRTKEDLPEYIAQQGPEFASREYDRMLKSQAVGEYLKNNNLVGKDEWSWGRKMASYLSDVKPLSKSIDLKLGSNMESTIDKISTKLNKTSYLRANAIRKMEQLRKISKKNNISGEDIYQALETKNADGKLPEPLYRLWNNYWEQQRKAAKSLGLDVQELADKTKDYVPHRRLDTVQYTRKLNNMIADFDEPTTNLLQSTNPRDLKRLKASNDNIPQLIDEMGQLFEERPTTPARFAELLQELRNPQKLDSAILMKTKAVMKRGDQGIPEAFREKNVYELAKQWSSQTLRHAALRDDISELNVIKQAARDADDPWLAGYIDRLQKDILGVRGDTGGQFGRELSQKFEIRMNKAADEFAREGKSLRAAVARGATYAPEVYRMAVNSIYPNMLGMNPKSIIQNLASPTIMNMPELGPVYGTKIIGNAALDMAASLKKGVEVRLSPDIAEALGAPELANKLINTKEATKYNMSPIDLLLGSEGIVPQQWTGELAKGLRSEVKNSSLYKMADSANVVNTNIAMSLFEASEKMARAQTYFTAKRVAKDLVAGKKGAVKWFDQLNSPAYKREIAQAMKNNDDELVDKLTQRYFQSTNMFNYDRANMSEAGRFLGPLVSTFSKWPTSIAGRVMQEYYDSSKSEAAKRIGKQLVAPYALLAAANEMLDDAEKNPRVNVVVGQSGLQGWTPGESVFGWVTGDQFAPPIASTVLGPARAALKGEGVSGVSKSAQSAATALIPGAWTLKLMGSTLPQLYGINTRKQRNKGGSVEKKLYNTQKLLRKMGVQ